MKKSTLLLVFVFLISVMLTGCGGSKDAAKSDSSAPKTMKLTSVNTKDRALNIGLEKFAEIVNAKSGGKIKVEVYADSILGGERQILEGIQRGTIEGGLLSTAITGTVEPKASAFDLPFLFADTAKAFKVLDGPTGTEVLKDLAGKKLVAFGYWDSGFRHLTNSKHEVATLESMNGLKIRTMESKVHVETWKALGVNPTPMAFNQLYSALEQKVVDGQENPYIVISNNKLYEVQRYLTNSGHVYSSSIFVVSQAFWDKLSDSEKDIITKAEIEAREFERKLNAEQELKCKADLASQGMIISDLAPGEKDKIIEKLQPVYKNFAETIKGDFVNRVIAEAKS